MDLQKTLGRIREKLREMAAQEYLRWHISTNGVYVVIKRGFFELSCFQRTGS